jgi:hypothetical protein
MWLLKSIVVDYETGRGHLSNDFHARYDDGGEVEQESRFTGSQTKLFDQVAKYIGERLPGGATEYTGKTLADIPQEFLDAVESYKSFSSGVDNNLMSAVNQMLSMKPAFSYNEKESADYWNTAFATPALATWESQVRPTLEEGFSGNMFNTRAIQAVAKEKSDFYGSTILPALYSGQMADRQAGITSLENAFNRGYSMSTALPSIKSGLFASDNLVSSSIQQQEQAKLTDTYNRFLRGTDENNPWVQMALSLSTGAQPVYDNYVQQGTDWLGAGIQGLVTAAALGATGGTSKT